MDEQKKKEVREFRANARKPVIVPKCPANYPTPARWRKDYLAGFTKQTAGESRATARDKQKTKVTTMDSLTKKPEVDPIVSKPLFSEEDLKVKSFNELREIGNQFGTKGRSKVELISEILELQNQE